MAVRPQRNENRITATPRRFRAPGRINIIGEHTDYNDGFVLPANTALFTTVSAIPRNDGLIKIVASKLNATGEFRLDKISAGDSPDWLEYIKGVAAELQNNSVDLTGADLVIDGDIPIGRGLSSSASLELAVAHAFVGLAGASIPADALARYCQRAEIDYAGVNCGIMDQYSVACGQSGKAMLLDCRTLETQFVQIPETIAFIVTDSGVKHQHPDSGYNDRASECEEIVGLLQSNGADLRSLRDVTIELLDAQKDRLGDVLYRRARHVITENARTIAAVQALNDDNQHALGELINASHASLRDDYEISCNEVDALVSIANQCAGVAGSRMVGGGFGGCVLSVVAADKAAHAAEQIQAGYSKVIGHAPWTHTVCPADAAMEIEPQ